MTISNSKRLGGIVSVAALLMSVSACSNSSTTEPERAAQTDTAESNAQATSSPSATNTSAEAQADIDHERTKADKPAFTTQTIARFIEPWAMTALPTTDGTDPMLLVTQKSGELFVVDSASGDKRRISGVPNVAYGGQGGLGDIILAPDFASSQAIYISYVEAGSSGNTYGAKVIKATLTGLDTQTPRLQDITPIWQQMPKVEGQGHYSHRLLFSPDGQYLYISSGERQKKTPAQDMSVNLGKIVRLYPDGSVPEDNPFIDNKNNNSVTKQLWTLGHRNVLGMMFDERGQLWAHEMGPRGGDEFNLIKKGLNYGWPVVSNGRNYSGIDIPDHDTRSEFAAPHISWTPVISPSSISFYQAGTHNDFPAWQGDVLISGLSSKALIVVELDNDETPPTAHERYRYDMGHRIRSVLVAHGQVWVLEDGNDAQLLRLMPE